MGDYVPRANEEDPAKYTVTSKMYREDTPIIISIIISYSLFTGISWYF
jgi:hypothetical protein